MRTGHVSGQRQQPSDRNIIIRGGYWGQMNVAPHVPTSRVSYTVPTGKKAQVTVAMAHVIRITAAGVLDRAAAYILDPTVMICYAIIYNNTVGVSDKMNINLNAIRVAGDTIQAYTWDASTGGTCDYTVGFEVIEYDA